MYTVEKVRLEDYEQQIVGYGIEAYDQVDLRARYIKPNFDMEKFYTLEELGVYHFWVLRHDNQIVGCSITTLGKSQHTCTKHVTTELLYIEPGHRCSDASILLVQAVERWAETQQVGFMSVVLREGNDHYSLMRATGFEPSDLIYMKKIGDQTWEA